MPGHDPLATARLSRLRRLGVAVRAVALASLLAALAAVALVAWGSDGNRARLLIAAALGAALCVFVATAIMSLLFLRPPNGHGERARRTETKE